MKTSREQTQKHSTGSIKTKNSSDSEISFRKEINDMCEETRDWMTENPDFMKGIREKMGLK